MDSADTKQLNFKTFSFPNIGYALLDAPAIVTQEIRQELNLLRTGQKKPKMWNNELAGQIRGEFAMDFSATAQSELSKIGHLFVEANGETLDCDLQLLSAWINMQVKHEYNPIHSHDGALSWVTWVDIPYNLEDELKLYPNANCQDVSMFSFIYTTSLGEIAIERLPIDKTWEGKMCIFPARMRHSVAPFYTSDHVRISVAGNLG